jgi:uncharacterized membrane protein YdjX (TVP38/TMEM64 family)
MRRLFRLRVAAVAGLGLAIWALASYEPLVALLAPERIAELLNTAGPIRAPLLLMGLMALAVVVSPIPSLPLDVAAGLAFGPWLGTLYAATGALVGALIAFGLGRLLGREFVERVAGGHISFCAHCSNRLLVGFVLVARLFPLFSFDVISYGAGLTKMSPLWFAGATFLGMLPPTFALVAFGSAISLQSPITWLLAAGLVAVFLLLPRWIEQHNLFGLRRMFAEHGKG